MESSDHGHGSGGLVPTSHRQSGVPACIFVTVFPTPTNDRDDMSVLNWDETIMDTDLGESSGDTQRNSNETILERTPEESGGNEIIDSSTRLGRSQIELERSNSLSPIDLQRNLSQTGSFRLEQDLNFSQHNNSSSRNMSIGRGGSNDSLDPNTRVAPAAVGPEQDTLLARKLAVAPGDDNQINANSGNEVPLASTSPETQTELNHSRLHSSQTEQYRSNFVMPQTELEPNSRVGTVAVGSVHDSLLARKLAVASGTGNQINGCSSNQTQLFSTPTKTDRASISEDEDMLQAARTDISSDVVAEQYHMSRNQEAWSVQFQMGAAFDDKTSNFGNSCEGCTNNSDNAPGEQRRNNGDAYVTLFNRKMAGTDVPLAGNDITQQRCETKECISEVEARGMIADSSRCNELLNTLKRSSSLTQAGVMNTLAKLRDVVLVAHGVTSHDHSMSMESLDSQGPSKIVFPNDVWAKILTTAMSSHSSDIPVQVELLQTLWFIVTLHPQYVSHLTSIADMTQIITTMQTHTNEELIQEYGCGVLASIAAATEGHALRLLRVRNGEFVHHLMAALQFQSQQGNAQVHALKALGHLSLASISDESPRESFSKTMGRYVENGRLDIDSSVNAIETVVHAMKHYVANISVQIQGHRLLWSTLDPHFGIKDPDYYDILVVKTLRCIEAAMASHQQSQALHETIICLLSKMSCFQSAVNEKDLKFSLRLVVEAMKTETMKTHSNSWIVALHGCQCLANICKRSPSLLHSQPVVDGIPVIISCMKIFQDNVAIQSEACAALSFICINSPFNKERLNEMDGINRINYAYDLFSTNPSVVNKIRACTALTTLAVDPNILEDIEDKGIFAKFETLLKQDQTIDGELHEAILDLLILAPVEKNTRMLMFRDGAREDETCGWIRANLRVVAMQDCDPHHVNYLRSRTIHVMEKFLNSASIHEYGCKLLACLFHQALDDESFAQDRLIAELEMMHHSLKRHMNNPTNAIAACSALQNLTTLLSVSITDHVPVLNDALSRSLAEVAKALVKHGDNAETLERVTGALWALCGVRESLALSFKTDCSTLLIVTAMSRFPDSVDLRRHGIGLMGLFFSVSNNIIEYVTDELVSVIMRFIREDIDNVDAADLIDISVDMILTMSNMGFKAVATLVRYELLVETVVACMEKFPDSPSIQCAGIDILNEVAVDSSLRADICLKGGARRIIATLDELKHDPIVVCKAFAALANLVNGASVEFLHEHRASVLFVSAMINHPQNLYIQTVATNALLALSARNNLLKSEIVDAGGAEAISKSMTRFIASKRMQLQGFSALWALALPKHLQVRVGRCAIEAVTNGISAHISSEDACKNALGCLKCLSLTPVNKGLLDDYGAADLIYCCK